MKEKILPLLGTCTLKEMAKMFGVSESGLRRAMKRLKLKQPKKWVRASRLKASRLGGEAAKQALSDPEACKRRYRARNAARPPGYYHKFKRAELK